MDTIQVFKVLAKPQHGITGLNPATKRIFLQVLVCHPVRIETSRRFTACVKDSVPQTTFSSRKSKGSTYCAREHTHTHKGRFWIVILGGTHLHLVPRSRMREAIPPLPQYVFMARCLVKHRDNFTFTFILGGTVDSSFSIAMRLRAGRSRF
jgi:hypothetical protein